MTACKDAEAGADSRMKRPFGNELAFRRMRPGRLAAALLLVLSAAALRLSSTPALAQSSVQPARQSDGTVTPPQSPRNANYTIDARLDSATRTIAAAEAITWRNITTK